MNSRLAGIRSGKARSYSEIEALASSVRLELGYDSSTPFKAKRFFEHDLGLLTVSHRGVEIALQESIEPSDSEGLTRWDPDSKRIYVGLSQESYDMLNAGHVRAAYTLAHEFGHAILHTAQLIRLASLSQKSQAALHRDNRGDHPAYLDTEWQANPFASALLMPAQGVKRLAGTPGQLTPEQISKGYRVSHQAAIFRLESYKRLSI